MSPLALGLQALAALLIPLLAALLPILRGTAITVRQAIASYGIGSSFGGSRLDVLIEALGRRFLSAPYAMTLAYMFRKQGRVSASNWTKNNAKERQVGGGDVTCPGSTPHQF